MAHKAEPTIIFIFEDEVREAARKLAALRDLRDAPDDDVLAQTMNDALHACMAALAGAEDDAVAILMTRKSALWTETT